MNKTLTDVNAGSQSQNCGLRLPTSIISNSTDRQFLEILCCVLFLLLLTKRWARNLCLVEFAIKMPSCSAANCKNKHEDGVRLFRWPSAPERARLWLERCGRANSGWQPKPSSRLCEKHFDSSQFEEHRQDGWRKLKPNAVPTLFSNEAHSCTVRRPRASKKRTVTLVDEHQSLNEGRCYK